MNQSIVDLRTFHPRFRQALLFSMIEGLLDGCSFAFIDNKSSSELQSMLDASGLSGYRWTYQENKPGEILVVIERASIDKVERADEGVCCGCNCGKSDGFKNS